MLTFAGGLGAKTAAKRKFYASASFDGGRNI
jgi:hypothetical protein